MTNEPNEVYDIELSEDLLKENERLAKENAELLARYKVRTIDVLGAVGSGKTSLIEQIVKRLRKKLRIAVFKGDLTSSIDVERIAKLGIATVQISTGKECHLDANLVKKALSRVDLASLDLILIENVGNLICPAEFHLGSDTRVVVTSVTEGPYMIVKHPFIFMDAKLAVVNKIDLAEAMGVDIEALKYDLKTVNPAIVAIPTNCRTGEGVEDVIQALGL